MSDTVAKKMYADGFAEPPPGLLPESPTDPQPGAASSSAAPQAKAKKQPMFKSSYPARRPGLYNQNYLEMDPKALVELKRIEDNSMNEIERSEAAIRLCMRYVVDQSEETFAKFRERFVYMNKGRGFDLYPKKVFSRDSRE